MLSHGSKKRNPPCLGLCPCIWSPVPDFSGATVTNSHRPGVKNNRNYSLMVLEARSPKSRCGRAWFLPEAPRKNLVQPASSCWWFTATLGAPWLVDTSSQCPSALPHGALLCAFPVSRVAFSEGHQPLDVGPAPNPGRPSLTNYIYKDRVFQEAHTLRSQETGVLEGTLFSPVRQDSTARWNFPRLLAAFFQIAANIVTWTRKKGSTRLLAAFKRLSTVA